MWTIYEKINGRSMTDKEIDMYMKRLGLQRRAEPDLEFLTELQRRHISTIPFENLDIIAGRPVSLDRERLFEKIIVNKRGGVCSELNTLYNWLLASLGYEVVSYSSRIIAKTRPIQARSHRIIAVTIGEDRYLTDVGFNYEHHRIPIKLEEGLEQSDGECRYKMTKDGFFGWLMWQERPGLGWRKKIGFPEDPCIDQDFAAATFFAENHKDSAINKFVKVSLHIDGVFYGIRSGNFLKEIGGVEHIIEENISAEREKELLHDIFHLKVVEQVMK